MPDFGVGGLLDAKRQAFLQREEARKAENKFRQGLIQNNVLDQQAARRGQNRQQGPWVNFGQQGPDPRIADQHQHEKEMQQRGDLSDALQKNAELGYGSQQAEMGRQHEASMQSMQIQAQREAQQNQLAQRQSELDREERGRSQKNNAIMKMMGYGNVYRSDKNGTGTYGPWDYFSRSLLGQ